LQLARLADLPKEVLMEAGEVARRLNDVSAQKNENSESIKVARRRKAVLKVDTLWRINLVLRALFGFSVSL
jgi:DNA mismatch repair protein MSH4